LKPSKLGNLTTVLSGFAFKSELFGQTGGMPLVRIRDVVRGKSETNYGGPYEDRYIVQNGDMLIGMDGEFNLARWQGGPALLNQRVCKIRSSSDRLDDGYLFWYLPKALKSIEDKTPYVTVKHLSVRDLSDIEIPIPFPDDPRRSLAEQKRIAAILDKADAIRRRRQEAARLADTLIPSVFYEMFDKWLRQPTSEMPRIGDPTLSNIASGVTKGRHFLGVDTVTVPYIRVANVQDGHLDLSEIKTIEALPGDVEALRLQHGDVLMTEGGDFDKLGRGAMWEADIPDCIHQNHVFRVRCVRKRLMPEFFACYIQSPLARAYFLKCAKKTSNLASINMTQLRALPIPEVPIEEQRTFSKRVKSVRALQATQASASADGDVLFNSLVQRAFRGEL
jgi:type I restriction enzyme, S subunit